jgi:hypothetical protein
MSQQEQTPLRNQATTHNLPVDETSSIKPLLVKEQEEAALKLYGWSIHESEV